MEHITPAWFVHGSSSSCLRRDAAYSSFSVLQLPKEDIFREYVLHPADECDPMRSTMAQTADELPQTGTTTRDGNDHLHFIGEVGRMYITVTLVQ